MELLGRVLVDIDGRDRDGLAWSGNAARASRLRFERRECTFNTKSSARTELVGSMPQPSRRYDFSPDRIGDRHIQLFLCHVCGRSDIEQCSLHGRDLIAITIIDVPWREHCPVGDNGGILGAEAKGHRQMEPCRADIA
jgi:hypothetical protein